MRSHAVGLGDFHHQVPGLSGIPSPMHLTAASLGVALELQQMFVQPGEGIGSHDAGMVAQGFGVGKGAHLPQATIDEVIHRAPQGLLQGGILQGDGGAMVEGEHERRRREARECG